MKVEGTGFKISQQKDVVVEADAGARVDMQFQVGGATETVEVTAEAPQLKTDRADVAVTFNERAVVEVPILNRNFTELQLMAPGSQKIVGWSHAATENPQQGYQIFTQGQHFSGTGFELDGTDNQDPILGIIVVNPNLDAVTEAKVALQNYDAEFGKAVASLVTSQTKSGSNSIHGSGFLYRRSDWNQARDPFSQSAPDKVTGRFVATVALGTVWRHHWRSDHKGQAVLFRRLSGNPAEQWRKRIVHGSDTYRPHYLRPHDESQPGSAI